MIVEKLRECNQSALMEATGGFSTEGVCFYMSSYVEEKLWHTGSYVEVEATARVAIPSTIIKAAKAVNLKDRSREYQHRNNARYADTATAAKVYQVSLWFGAGAAPAPRSLDSCNHQILAAFHTRKVLFFDPNFGFYVVTDAAMGRQAMLEAAVQGLYTAIAKTAANFYYLPGRTLS